MIIEYIMVERAACELDEVSGLCGWKVRVLHSDAEQQMFSAEVGVGQHLATKMSTGWRVGLG